MRIQAVIFDLDGVIVSTDHLHYLAWKRLADELRIPFDEEVNHRLRGISRMESLRIILEASSRSYSASEQEELAKRKNSYYRVLLQSLTERDILPGVEDVLEGLAARGIQTAIGSSSKNALLIMQRIGLNDRFPVIVDGNDIRLSKPDPEVFRLAAERLQTAPESCLVVEDAVAGLEAGLAACMRVATVGDASKDARSAYALRDLTEFFDKIQFE